jgi:hypothetical protein
VGVGACADGVRVGTGGSGVGVACGPLDPFETTVTGVGRSVGSGTRRTPGRAVDGTVYEARLARATQASKTASKASRMAMSHTRITVRGDPSGLRAL